MELKIPKMILQPLVENAITHGLEPRGEGGSLTLGGALGKDGQVKLWVEDNGVGMPREQLEWFQAVISDSGKMESDSIGGDGCGVQIQSEEGKGTRVELNLPWFREAAGFSLS